VSEKKVIFGRLATVGAGAAPAIMPVCEAQDAPADASNLIGRHDRRSCWRKITRSV